jgi:hypothetical protein
MSPSSTTIAESVQTRLESISMRLDAATDNLLQTRDLLIKNLEHQMLQLQEVRAALHEAAIETSHWAQTAEAQRPPAAPKPAAAAPLQPAIKPMGELTLESLFAPLNSVPRPAPTVPESAPPEEVPFVNTEVLFECEPAGHWETMSTEAAKPCPVLSGHAMDLQSGFTQVAQTNALEEMDPALEKATLDELNEALTRAFAQIANRQASS